MSVEIKHIEYVIPKLEITNKDLKILINLTFLKN